MLPADVLLDILRCMSRNTLDKIQETNQAINNIVSTEFASKPCRLLGEEYCLEIHIKTGKLLLWIYKNDTLNDRECFVPSSRGWQKCDKEDDEPWCRRHRYTLDEMRQYLPEYVRFRTTRIFIEQGEHYTPNHISAIKSIAHVWSEQTLTLDDFSDSDTNILSSILNNFDVLQCRVLRLNDGKKMFFGLDVSQHPALNKLKAIFFCSPFLKADDMASLTQKKAICAESDTIFLVAYKYDDLIHAVEAARKEFMESIKPCRLKMMIHTDESLEVCFASFHTGQTIEFCVKNNRTNEVLEFKREGIDYGALTCHDWPWRLPSAFSLDRYSI
ncbi:hypothetical protein DdX_14300 [Ditylenchus destructor]|uniref:F-box domain-containing protein n=1 Tax=Ditylenchus destructor TaxID=166010 RepID=A0AAD4MS57_9BILA|nr:hypothetical protein DdX_14300 [Ditylenchus destructor]